VIERKKEVIRQKGLDASTYPFGNANYRVVRSILTYLRISGLANEHGVNEEVYDIIAGRVKK